MNPLNILIVEDNNDLAEGIQWALEQEGLKVTAVSSGEEATSLIQKNNFDLFLLDVKLPGMDGIAVLLKILDLDPEAKVIIMTAYKIDSLLMEVQDRGAISILRKPFEVEKLLQLIAEIQKDIRSN
jgi:DNA-binding NtrC family response regulator